MEPSTKFQPYLQEWGPRNCYIVQHSNALNHLLQRGFVTNLTFSTQGRLNFTNQGVQEILSWRGDVPPPRKTSTKCSPKCCSTACGLGSGTLERSRMNSGTSTWCHTYWAHYLGQPACYKHLTTSICFRTSVRITNNYPIHPPISLPISWMQLNKLRTT